MKSGDIVLTVSGDELQRLLKTEDNEFGKAADVDMPKILAVLADLDDNAKSNTQFIGRIIADTRLPNLVEKMAAVMVWGFNRGCENTKTELTTKVLAALGAELKRVKKDGPDPAYR